MSNRKEDPVTEHVGGELVLDAPGNTHVGTLYQPSPTAPDGILYQSPDMPRLERWEHFIVDGNFRVLTGPLNGQYVYDDADAVKAVLNAVAAHPEEMRKTYG